MNAFSAVFRDNTESQDQMILSSRIKTLYDNTICTMATRTCVADINWPRTIFRRHAKEAMSSNAKRQATSSTRAVTRRTRAISRQEEWDANASPGRVFIGWITPQMPFNLQLWTTKRNTTNMKTPDYSQHRPSGRRQAREEGLSGTPVTTGRKSRKYRMHPDAKQSSRVRRRISGSKVRIPLTMRVQMTTSSTEK